MTTAIIKRHIGIIPVHETKNKGYFENFKRVILPNWMIIPDTLFYKLSYEKLLQVSKTKAAYNIVIASRMKDDNNPEVNNICSAANEIRNGLGFKTVFLLSFNDLQATVKGLDPAREKRLIEVLVNHEENPDKKSIGGIVRTSATDPLFLVSILGDILAGPKKYLDKTQVHHVESQTHFLNHSPGHTQYGIGE